MAELSDELNQKSSITSSHPTGEGIVLDIGTGDGLFVYKSARENPRKFYIGIDANTRPLEKISEKVHRKPSKGGLPNVLFLRAAIEDLPEELNGVADEIHVHFPWGSLLGGLLGGDGRVLIAIRRLCAVNALLELVMGLDPQRDRTELSRLAIAEFTPAQIRSRLAQPYLNAGFEITEVGELLPSDWPHIHSTWAKRLAQNPNRSLTYLIARAIK